MTLVNNNRRDITIVFDKPDDFSIDGVKQSERAKIQDIHISEKFSPDIQRIVKQSPHSKSYILNTSNYAVFMDYYIKSENGEEIKVGPDADSILPGQFKEIGAGPGVIWRIRRI